MRRIFLKGILLSLLWIPLSALADTPAPATNDFNSDERATLDALHSLLMHGDLTDIDDVSKRLGIHLYRRSFSFYTPAEATRHAYEITATVPHFLLPGVAYEAYSDATRNTTRVDLKFTVRVCPDLRRLSKDWKLSLEDVMLTDAAGDRLVLSGPGTNPIKLETGSGNNCRALLWQTRSPSVVYPTTILEVRGDGADIVRKTGDVISVGDLRDYRKNAKALGVELLPFGEQRNGLLYKGFAILEEPIAGVDASMTQYQVQDSGWQMPPGFFARPYERVPRSASLRLSIDTEHVCIPAKALQQELRRRSIGYQNAKIHGQPALFSNHVGNRFKISYRLFDQCVEEFFIVQTTGKAH